MNIQFKNIMSNNFNMVSINGVNIYFSYQTAIGVMSGGKSVISVNDWGPTTGKHLNYLEQDKSKRVPQIEVEQAITRLLA